MFSRLRLLGAFAAAALLAGTGAPAAHAGTYDVSISTADDVSGWQFFHDPGFYGCSIHSHPGPCADGDVPSPTPLRIFAYGSAAHLANAYWEWLAPPTTTIEHGSVRVVAATSASDTYAYMKARLRSEAFVGSPQLHVTSDDGALIWSIPSGNEGVGVFLKTDSDRTYSDKWKNTIRVTDLTATLRDDTAPRVALSGPLAAGGWLNQSQQANLTVAAEDAGAGVAAASLRSAGTVLDSDAVPARAGAQPGRTSSRARWARLRRHSATAATPSTWWSPTQPARPRRLRFRSGWTRMLPSPWRCRPHPRRPTCAPPSRSRSIPGRAGSAASRRASTGSRCKSPAPMRA